MTFPPAFSALPSLGTGLSWRGQLREAVRDHEDRIDWLEVITDRYLDAPRELDELRALRERFPIVPHSLNLSVGSDSPLDVDYVTAVAKVADVVDAPWVSDHLCFSREGEVRLDSLLPVVRTAEKVDAIAANVREIEERVGRPFVLENITYYVDMPGDLSEPEMLRAVLEAADCGLLLDLNNVAINCRNHGGDPFAFLDALPLERVVQVHLAGNSPEAHVGAVWTDFHDGGVSEEVFALLRHLLARCTPKAVNIERDDTEPDIAELFQDLGTARSIFSAAVHGDQR